MFISRSFLLYREDKRAFCGVDERSSSGVIVSGLLGDRARVRPGKRTEVGEGVREEAIEGGGKACGECGEGDRGECEDMGVFGDRDADAKQNRMSIFGKRNVDNEL